MIKCAHPGLPLACSFENHQSTFFPILVVFFFNALVSDATSRDFFVYQPTMYGFSQEDGKMRFFPQ